MQKRNVLSKIVSCTLAFALLVTTLTTNELVANAEGLLDNEPDVIEANSIEEVTLKDTVDTNSDSDFKSCRLIIFSSDNLEFEDAKSVTKYEGKYFVEYKNPKTTEEAYNSFIGKGIEVEIDVVSDTPEDVENKDDKDKEVSDKEIAKTNDKDKPTESIEMAKKNDNEDKNIVVAVLDTGLNVGEDVFTDRVIEGKNFVDEGKEDNTEDINGHGTSMARVVLDTVGAENEDSNIKIMPIKVLNDEGKGTTLTAYQGIKYAIEKKVDVINLSMSGVGQSKLLTSAINEAYNNGIPVVVSAGNSDKDIKEFTPANISSAFTISATDIITDNNNNVEYKKASYSNYGKGIDYTTSGQYEFVRIIDNKEVVTKIEGTSVSSAYVTSYIALLKQMALSDEDDNNDNLSILDYNESLYNSAIDLENTEYFGEGYLTKENIVLRYSKDTIKPLEVENVEGLKEDITLQANATSKIWDRQIHVINLPAGGNWYVRVRITDDTNKGMTLDNSEYVDANNGWSDVWMQGFDGQYGHIQIFREDDTRVRIEYYRCNLTTQTPYIEAGVYNTDKYTVTGSTRWWSDYDNSIQNFVGEFKYKADEYKGSWVDFYGGMRPDEGWDGSHTEEAMRVRVYDLAFFWEPKNFKVNYIPWGGTWTDNNEYNTIRGCDYNKSGANAYGQSVGRYPVPRRDGYIFKGWYFSQPNGFAPQFGAKHPITDIVDYANRYPDLYSSFAAYDYNAHDLATHFWNNGYNEGRTISEYNRSYTDYTPEWEATDMSGSLFPTGEYPNPNGNYDEFRQVLPPNKGICCLDDYNLCGTEIVAHAVWEKAPGYKVTYDTNGGTFKDGTSTKAYNYDATGYSKEASAFVGLPETPTKQVVENGETKTYVFKGWYPTYDDNTLANEDKPLVEIMDYMIDYYHRYPDLHQTPFTTLGVLNLTELWMHWNNYGNNGEGRSYAQSPRTIRENDLNNLNYDNGKMLIKANEYVGFTHREHVYGANGRDMRFIAIWDESPGFTVTYDTNGGKFTDGTSEVTYGYSEEGINTTTAEEGIGIHDIPTREEKDKNGETKKYIFRGWYFTDDTSSSSLNTKQSYSFITNLIDYYNRYADLKAAFTTIDGKIDLPALWTHWNQYGQHEGRTFATSPKTIKENDNNDLNYDDYNMLLKGNEFAKCYQEGIYNIPKGTNLRAIAIWEDATDVYKIEYDIYGNLPEYVRNQVQNNPNNPNLYTKDDKVVTIYEPIPTEIETADGIWVFKTWNLDSIETPKDNSKYASPNDEDVYISEDNEKLSNNTLYSVDGTKMAESYHINWWSKQSNGYRADDVRGYSHSYWSSDSHGSGKNRWSHSYKVKGTNVYCPRPHSMTPEGARLNFDLKDTDLYPAQMTSQYGLNWIKNTPEKVAQIVTHLDFAYWKLENYSGRYGIGDYMTSNSSYITHHKYTNAHDDVYSHDKTSRTTTKEGDSSGSSMPKSSYPNNRITFGQNCVDKRLGDRHYTARWEYQTLPQDDYLATAYYTSRSYTLPTPTRNEYDFLGWWGPADSQGNGVKFYPPGSKFKPDETLDPAVEIKFTAIWRRNCGQVQYNPNGATYDNKQPYTKTLDGQKTRLVDQYRTQSGAIFGNEAKVNEYVTRDPQHLNDPTKYIYYKTDKGTITNSMGTDYNLASFQGWAPITYAIRDKKSYTATWNSSTYKIGNKQKAETRSSKLLYAGNAYYRFMNLFYDAEAVGTLGIQTNPKGMTLEQVANAIKNISEGKPHGNVTRYFNMSLDNASGRHNGNWYKPIEDIGIIDYFATWDYYPVFNNCPDSVSVTSDFINHATKADILERILEKDKVTVTDKEDGNLKPFVNLVNFDMNELRELAKNKTGSTTVTLQVIDSSGNITEKFVTLWINQSVSAESYSSGNVIDGYTRFINKESYNAPFEKGGLLDNSEWKVNYQYRNELIDAFNRIDNANPMETWEFTKDDAKDAQEYVKNNGLGNSKASNKLSTYNMLIQKKKKK